ncbi:MAG: membrane protein insertase YidC [Thermodesulfobacteriota bacterium]
MEQLRLLIAVVLSFIVFFGWNYFYGEKTSVTDQSNMSREDNRKTQDNSFSEKTDQASPDKQAASGEEKKDIIKNLPVDEKEYTIETPDYIAVISSVGAKISSFKLKNYKEKNKEDAPFKEMIDQDFMDGSYFVDFNSVSGLNLKKANFLSDMNASSVVVDSGRKEVSFEYQTENGIKIIKDYIFYGDSYLFDCNVTVINNTGNTFSNQLNVSINTRKPESRQIGFVGPAVFNSSQQKVKQIDIDDIPEEGSFRSEIDWGGLESIYFLSAVVPDFENYTATDFKVVEDRFSGARRQYIKADFLTEPFNLNSGDKKTFNYHYYIGPKSTEILKDTGFNLDKSVNFGFIDVISKPCLWVLNFIYKFIPNYGVSIILLTLLVKLVFWPLGTKSAKSMDQMKKIQPLMKEIREKYKNDKQKMNQEVMNLYKTYKVNPLSGCLPILVQIPIFFGLYRMLFSAIELRHAPFMLWIQDLSAPDRLFDLNFAIPFMKEPYGIPLLTIIMGASMFLQQKMTPAAGDPTQAKMMMFMPVLITVIFINLPAGLVLYMLVNNIFSMAQQYYVTHSLSK